MLHITQLYAQQQDFFLKDWQPKLFKVPAYVDTVYPADEANTFITVNPADTITRVSNFIFGGNANIYSTIMYNNAQLVKNIRNLNPHVLRYPGGNLSNEFFWNLEPGNPQQDVPDGINIRYGHDEQEWAMSVDNFYRFLDSVNCEGLITINYSYARYGTSANPVEKAAHLAAQWVRYDNGRTRFWEIGNENFGSWQSGYEIDTTINHDGQPRFISGDLYGRHCRTFIDSMKSAAAEIGHEIFIGVVTFEAETSWDNVQTNWNEGMIPHIGDIADFYVVHNYYTPYEENSTASVILNSYRKTEDFITAVNDDVTDAGFSPKPVVLNEWNIFAIGSMQQVSHINGMHAALILGESIKQGYGCTARWNLANGWDNGNDHGMFSSGGEPDVELFAPRPAFHHMTWFQRVFGDVMISSTVAGRNPVVTCYASSFTDGQTGIVLINRSPSWITADLSFADYDLGNRYYWYILRGGNDNGDFSRKVYINNIGPEGLAGGPENYDKIPAFSKEINRDTVQVGLPGYSVAYMLIEGKKSVSTTSVLNNTNSTSPLFQVYPNPAKNSIYINSAGFKYNEIIIYNILGQEVQRFNKNNNKDIQKLEINLTKGAYFIYLKNSKTYHSQKIIVY